LKEKKQMSHISVVKTPDDSELDGIRYCHGRMRVAILSDGARITAVTGACRRPRRAVSSGIAVKKAA
jgi:hypothetical protein